MTNYEILFGSPELAAMTLQRIVHKDGYAHLLGIDALKTVVDILDWLHEESEDDDD